MNREASNVIRVGFEHVDSLERVIVEHSDLHVVWARDDPIFSRHKFARAHGRLADLERFH